MLYCDFFFAYTEVTFVLFFLVILTAFFIINIKNKTFNKH